MSKRKPAVSTQLKNALITIEAQKNELSDWEKKLKSMTETKDMYYKQHRDAIAEIEQIHLILDAFPNSPQRKTDGENSWDKTELTLSTRFAAWLGTR